ncbi:hypothetical protein [Streptomyces sp. NBC_00076]|uniref:NucA/NucB deoxyribonuclease domain-containing protein n=1 Tax=Streptomyces sp. NBC_00076 TaxID=2975642 RepID=UPI003249505A
MCTDLVVLPRSSGCAAPQPSSRKQVLRRGSDLRTVPSFFYDRAQSDTAGIANHSYDALYKPKTNYPSKAGKAIPGDIWNGNSCPLHRSWANYEAAAAEVARKNRNAKDAACRGLSRPNHSYQCDKFPFASTKEGVGLGDGNFSVRYVPGAENPKGGDQVRLEPVVVTPFLAPYGGVEPLTGGIQALGPHVRSVGARGPDARKAHPVQPVGQVPRWIQPQARQGRY